jgi:hypothetical protein
MPNVASIVALASPEANILFDFDHAELRSFYWINNLCDQAQRAQHRSPPAGRHRQ